MLDPIFKGIAANPANVAIIDSTGAHTYAALATRIDAWRDKLATMEISPGAVFTIESDYSLEAVAVLLAAAQARAIVVPLSRDSAPHLNDFLEISQAEWRSHPSTGLVETTSRKAGHALYEELRGRGTAGLVLFTSGSTGRNKAALHDLDRLCAKFAVSGRTLRTLVFLQPDHIGGLNTLFYTLANSGTVVVPQNRAPAEICDLIEAWGVQLLPTSPTFLNLLLLTRDPDRHLLRSLELITYGTEPMPQATLERVRQAFPHARLQQTYGLTEVGILRSQSRPDGSLWVRVGGEGYDVQVRDGRLWIKAQSAMLGYLNAPTPFSADGYLDTGDRVEIDGEWMRILGRETEIINVGGNKVYPAEVENVLLDMPNVADVAVAAAPHPLMGQIVSATFQLVTPEPLKEFKARLRSYCADKMPSFKVPAKITISETPVYSGRFKRLRRNVTEA